MNDKNLLIVENKKPVEIVQQIENAWEKEIELAEGEIRAEINFEDDIYEAEIIEDNNYSESSLVHQPPFPKTQPSGPLFYVQIKLKDCYFTDAGTLTSFLWFHNQVKILTFKKVEGVQELLHKLIIGTVRIVSTYGLESQKTSELKTELIAGLQNYIQKHKNGELVIAEFNE